MKYVLTLLLLAEAAFAQTGPFLPSDPVITNGFFNGRSWKRADRASRNDYVGGLMEGMSLQAYMDKKDPIPTPAHYVVADWANLIDQFYADPANIRLPIVVGWQWANNKLLGWSESRLKDFVEGWRAFIRSKE